MKIFLGQLSVVSYFFLFFYQNYSPEFFSNTKFHCNNWSALTKSSTDNKKKKKLIKNCVTRDLIRELEVLQKNKTKILPAHQNHFNIFLYIKKKIVKAVLPTLLYIFCISKTCEKVLSLLDVV